MNNASPVWSPAIGLYILDIDAVVISTKDPLIWNHGHHPKQAIPELSLEGAEMGMGGSFQTPDAVFLKIQKLESIASLSVGTSNLLSSLNKKLG